MLQQALDFRDESDALLALLEPLAEADFDRPTRFKQWTLNHILCHLHLWNRAVDLTLRDEGAFLTLLDRARAARADGSPMGLRRFESQESGGLRSHSGRNRKRYRERYGKTFHDSSSCTRARHVGILRGARLHEGSVKKP